MWLLEKSFPIFSREKTNKQTNKTFGVSCNLYPGSSRLELIFSPKLYICSKYMQSNRSARKLINQIASLSGLNPSNGFVLHLKSMFLTMTCWILHDKTFPYLSNIIYAILSLCLPTTLLLHWLYFFCTCYALSLDFPSSDLYIADSFSSSGSQLIYFFLETAFPKYLLIALSCFITPSLCLSQSPVLFSLSIYYYLK